MGIEDTKDWLQLMGIAFGTIGAVVVALVGFKKGDKETIKLLETATKRLNAVETEIKEIKAGFKVAFDEYEIRFKNEPEMMGMLKSLREIIEN